MRWWILVIGIICIAIGVFTLRYVIKHPIPKERDYNKIILQGYVAAFSFIFLGTVLIYRELF
jgi:hypothetical protein